MMGMIIEGGKSFNGNRSSLPMGESVGMDEKFTVLNPTWNSARYSDESLKIP
jgi:hypothetical protein